MRFDASMLAGEKLRLSHFQQQPASPLRIGYPTQLHRTQSHRMQPRRVFECTYFPGAARGALRVFNRLLPASPPGSANR